MAYHLQIAVDMLKSFVSTIVITTTNPRTSPNAPVTVIHRRLQQETCLSEFKGGAV